MNQLQAKTTKQEVADKLAAKTYWEQVYNMSDEEWPKYIKDIEDAIERRKIELAEAEKRQAAALEEARLKGIEQAKQDAEKKAIEESERIAQASDKDKFSVLVSYLENLPAIEPKSAKHKKLLAEVKDLNAKVIAHIKSKA
jgi:flagellar biosynthesis/type III secretory pathway protein FliH